MGESSKSEIAYQKSSGGAKRSLKPARSHSPAIQAEHEGDPRMHDLFCRRRGELQRVRL